MGKESQFDKHIFSRWVENTTNSSCIYIYIYTPKPGRSPTRQYSVLSCFFPSSAASDFFLDFKKHFLLAGSSQSSASGWKAFEGLTAHVPSEAVHSVALWTRVSSMYRSTRCDKKCKKKKSPKAKTWRGKKGTKARKGCVSGSANVPVCGYIYIYIWLKNFPRWFQAVTNFHPLIVGGHVFNHPNKGSRNPAQRGAAWITRHVFLTFLVLNSLRFFKVNTTDHLLEMKRLSRSSVSEKPWRRWCEPTRNYVSNYSDRKHALTPNGGLVREILLFQGADRGLWNIIIWPECMVYLPTWMVRVYGKCRYIYHTWILWILVGIPFEKTKCDIQKHRMCQLCVCFYREFGGL